MNNLKEELVKNINRITCTNINRITNNTKVLYLEIIPVIKYNNYLKLKFECHVEIDNKIIHLYDNVEVVKKYNYTLYKSNLESNFPRIFKTNFPELDNIIDKIMNE